MARLDMKLEHGQSVDVAQAKFEASVAEAVERYGSWIARLDWSDDRHCATATGTGYEVRLWYDERFVHVQGQVPLAWKLFEGAIRSRIRKAIDRPLASPKAGA